jgi:hypothetical protein
MQELKKWLRNNDGTSELIINGVSAAEINRRGGSAKVGQNNYTIKSQGFFVQTIVISNDNKEPISILKPKNWYTASYLFEYEGKSYQMTMRNNPLAEFVIKKDDVGVLAYGLGKSNVKNTMSLRIEENVEQPLIFHVLLWYLFEPVAFENSGDLIMIISMLFIEFFILGFLF